MAKKPRIFSIAELIHGGRPLTGADSLDSDLRRPSISPQSSLSNQSTRPIPSNSTSNPNPRILTPLNYPAIIDGNLTLPAVSDGASSSNSSIRCFCNSCFQFSDGSATICCDILDLDPFIIGKKIRVLAWNFIPIKRVGGFLEIIRWSFPDSENGRPRCLDGDSFPLAPSSSRGCENSSKSRYRLHGSLESVSPISVNPCTSGDSNSRSTTGSNLKPSFNIRGFLVRILVCECRLCNSKESFTILNCSVQEQNAHNFTKPVIVYFCVSASSWHPVIVKLIGKVVTISGLKKKLVYIGNEESILMYVTSEKSYLHVPRFQEKFVPGNQTYVEGKGECGSYTGIVKGVYMQGMVVELDHEVWLLLTSHLFTAPHSLRIGALISVKNVHFVNPKFSWTKMLILGACYKTSITIECFSPFVTGCHILSDSRSVMGNFIESLTFSARLWVLLLVSCFRKKFAGILSEKEILGSKHREGLVQIYANSQLPSSMFLSSVNKHGIFMLLCKHDSCGCEGRSGNLMLIVPIVTFINHCHAKWMRMIQLEHDKTLQKENLYSLLLCEGRPYDQSIRKIFSSEDIGIVLIGNLKISPTSGRLQLVDATGRIDVIVPDLPSTWNSNSIFEVVDYNLIIEGMPRLADNLELLDKCFSCRSIFNFIPLARDENLTVYVYFHLRNTACRNVSFYPRIEFGEDLERLESQTYHMLQVTHKFPALEKFQGDTAMSDPPSMFAEAVILSWNLSVARKDGFVHATKNSGDQPKKCMEHCNGKNDQEHISKRRKVDHASSRELSGLVDIPHNAERLRTCSNSDVEPSGKHSCCNCTSHEIPASATIKVAKNQSVVRSVILNYSGSNLNGHGLCRRSSHKVFLEFKPENFHIYQLLQIGCYYITEHYKEDSFCNFKDSDYVSGVKVLASSKLHLWSLSLTPDDVLPPTNLANCPPSDNSCHIGGDVVSSEAYNELCLQMPNRDCLESCSDVSLCLPANMRDILEVNMSELEERLIKPAVRPEGIAELFSCIGDVASAPLLPNINFLLPEGNLVSLRGHVVTVHGVDMHGNSQNHGDPLGSRLFSGVATTSCFHVMVEHQIVKVVGSLSKHVFPPGFGPGVDATFHRVLELRSQNKWMLTPVSFIVIHSIKTVN
ncbi:CST complex subunit CTC1, partial [Morus notabilis]|uniref:CST complex subunit CTC1 n=1 Tax=Morus notabilis TaxID=981085 RepID=UPI000CECE389